MDQAGILAQGDILDAMQAVLNLPVPPLELQQALGWGNLRREAGEAILHHLLALAFLGPGAPQAEDLGHARPVQVVRQIGGGDQVALLLGRPWPRACCVVSRRSSKGRLPGSGSKSRRMSANNCGWFSLTSSR